MYVVPVITGHGSLPNLISNLRESSSFFDSFCSYCLFLFHNESFQVLFSIFLLAFTFSFLFRSFDFFHGHSLDDEFQNSDKNKK